MTFQPLTNVAQTPSVEAFRSPSVDVRESGAVAALSRERYEIEGAMILARRFPRDEAHARARFLAAASRPTFARDALYVFPRGSATVEGPSVRLARELGRIWGNIRSGFRVVATDPDAHEIHVQGFAFDVESNAYRVEEAKARARIYRKGRWVSLLAEDLGGDTERQLSELVGRVGSKLERNCLLRLLPADLVDEVVEAVKIAQAQGVDPDALRRAVASFSRRGVSTLRLEGKLGKPLRAATPEDIATLRRWWKTIEDGEASVAELFPDEEPEPAAAPAKIVAPAVDLEEPKVSPPAATSPAVAPIKLERVEAPDEDDDVAELDLGPTVREPKRWTTKSRRAPSRAEPGDLWESEADHGLLRILQVGGADWIELSPPAAEEASAWIVAEMFAASQERRQARPWSAPASSPAQEAPPVPDAVTAARGRLAAIQERLALPASRVQAVAEIRLGRPVRSSAELSAEDLEAIVEELELLHGSGS